MAYRRVSFGGVDLMVHVSERSMRKMRSFGGLRSLPPAAQEGIGHPLSRLPAPTAAEAADLQRVVSTIDWYHTIDLGSGVVTDGWFDLREQVAQLPLPARLDGMRVLDVATFDGFWAFELERRGAAEVVAIDIDTYADLDMCPRLRKQKPDTYFLRKTGDGFRVAHQALGSAVRREVCNVYDLSVERLGRFDFVFLSDLLLHLANPMKALANVAAVTAGEALIVDVFNPALPGRLANYEGGYSHNIWWDLSFGALEQMLHDAGFASVEHVGNLPLGYRASAKVMTQAIFRCRNDRA